MKSFSVLFFIVFTIFSCKKEDSIQTFYVEHQERPDYSVVDISSTLLDINETNLTTTEKEAYQSLDKLHVLMYKATDSTQQEYKKELKAIKRVFSSEKYPELAVFNDSGIQFKIHSTAALENKDATVDELLVLGSADTMGFMVIRVLGDDLTIEKLATLITLLQKNGAENKALQGIMNFLK